MNKAKRLKAKGLHCVHKDTIDVEDVYLKMCAFEDKTQSRKREWLQTLFDAGSNTFSSGAPHNHSMCNACFMKYHNIARTTFFRLKRQAKVGQLRVMHGNTGSKKTRRSTLAALAWLEQYAKGSGDVMPDSGDIHLPDYRWQHVWAKMAASLKAHGDVPPTASQFLKVAKENMPEVKIVKTKRFSKCTTCDKLDTLIGKSTGEVRALLSTSRKRTRTSVGNRGRETSTTNIGRRRGTHERSTSACPLQSTPWTMGRLQFPKDRVTTRTLNIATN